MKASHVKKADKLSAAAEQRRQKQFEKLVQQLKKYLGGHQKQLGKCAGVIAKIVDLYGGSLKLAWKHICKHVSITQQKLQQLYDFHNGLFIEELLGDNGSPAKVLRQCSTADQTRWVVDEKPIVVLNAEGRAVRKLWNDLTCRELRLAFERNGTFVIHVSVERQKLKAALAAQGKPPFSVSGTVLVVDCKCRIEFPQVVECMLKMLRTGAGDFTPEELKAYEKLKARVARRGGR